MRKIIIAVAIGVLLIAAAFAMGMCASLLNGSPFGKGDVALVRIAGEIITADDIIEKLEDVRKDSSLKALLLRIDSPGGAVGASQEIFEEVKRVDAEKPVVASMGDVAASGGYYIACGARRIFALPGTVTGSIGVRMEHINLRDLLSWAKLNHETLKSGKFKDIGAIDRDISPAEREILQGLLSNMHAQFKAAVASSRKLTPEKIDEIADGRVYTGEQALALGLIDEIGGMPLALRSVSAMAGIKGEPRLKKMEDEYPWWVKYVAGVVQKLGFVSTGASVYKF